jgi:hypothetical protein
LLQVSSILAQWVINVLVLTSPFHLEVLFTVARAFNIEKLEQFAFWAIAASALGTVLAVFHFARKTLILINLWKLLRSKVGFVTPDNSDNIQKIRSVTMTQILLTLARLVAAGTAAVALPLSIAEQGYGDRLSIRPSLPSWIALVSVCSAVGATILFFVVEFSVRYSLHPLLGPFVCSSFNDEIKGAYNILSLPLNSFESTDAQERDAWEYTAREFLHKYRFDTVFAADRFGAILQYIQSGRQDSLDLETTSFA